jgi:hypothetical protein
VRLSFSLSRARVGPFEIVANRSLQLALDAVGDIPDQHSYAVSMNIEKRCNHYRLIVACILSGASQDRPVIVGWSTAPRGLVDCTSWSGHRGESWATPEETGSRPRVLARTEASRTNPRRNRVDHPTITGRSWDKFGTLEPGMPLWWLHFSRWRIHRAAIEKKEAAIWPLRATHPPGATATTPTAFSESLKGISGTTRGHCGSKVPGQQQI